MIGRKLGRLAGEAREGLEHGLVEAGAGAVGYLSARMPLGVMVILVVYSLRDLPLADPAHALPDILAVAATLGLHLWRRNAVLSILGGTAVHVALATAFPAL